MSFEDNSMQLYWVRKKNAWGLLKAYDQPVREWLKEHWLKRKSLNRSI